jgi:hypothetical protein
MGLAAYEIIGNDANGVCATTETPKTPTRPTKPPSKPRSRPRLLRYGRGTKFVRISAPGRGLASGSREN